jgi:isocitrate dehydrogenase kinase/phosphatase
MHYRDFHHALYGEEERVNDQKTFTNPFFLEIKKLIEAENLITGDVARYDHYGKTADGRVVLYDYGYTSDVWEKLYKDK